MGCNICNSFDAGNSDSQPDKPAKAAPSHLFQKESLTLSINFVLSAGTLWKRFQIKFQISHFIPIIVKMRASLSCLALVAVLALLVGQAAAQTSCRAQYDNPTKMYSGALLSKKPVKPNTNGVDGENSCCFSCR